MTFEIYIHVPFCLRRCGYCDFNTYTAVDMGAGASRGNYANMVIREMAIVRDWQTTHGINEPKVATVFFGGGTPTTLKASDLVAMLDAVRATWGIADDAEITTEANPDTVNADYVKELADGGFNRISFGMQSAVPHVLATLDRTHTPENVAAGIAAANAAGMRSSVDLIYARRGRALTIGAHPSAPPSIWASTIFPHMRSPSRRIRKWDDGSRRARCRDRTMTTKRTNTKSPTRCSPKPASNGMRLAIGLVPDTSRNTTLAIGGTSIGPVSVPVRIRIMAIAKTAKDCAPGISRIRDCGAPPSMRQCAMGRSERITAAEDIEETIMLGLRIREGLDTRQFSHLIPEQKWIELEHDGLITMLDGRAIPTLRGRLLNDTIITELLETLD